MTSSGEKERDEVDSENSCPSIERKKVSPVLWKMRPKKLDAFSSWCSEMNSASVSERPVLRVSEPLQERIWGDVTRKGTSLRVLQPMAWWKNFDFWVTLVEKKYKIHSQKARQKRTKAAHVCPIISLNFPVSPSQDLPFSEGQGTTNLTHLPP